MLAEFSIHPMDRAHMSSDVAKVIEILDDTGLDYRLGPMGTCVEGDWDQLMPALERCHRAVAERHERVITTIVIDECRDHELSLVNAIARVERHLGHPIKHS